MRSSPGRPSRSATSITTSSYSGPTSRAVPGDWTRRPISSARAASRPPRNRRRRLEAWAARPLQDRTTTSARCSLRAWPSSRSRSSRRSSLPGSIPSTSVFSFAWDTSSARSSKSLPRWCCGRAYVGSSDHGGRSCSCCSTSSGQASGRSRARPCGSTRAFISPSRGLLIYPPYLIFALAALLRAWRWPGETARRLRTLSLVWLATLVLYASYAEWWGGRVFGTRFLDDLAPLLFAALAWGIGTGMLRTVVTRALFGVLAAWSFLLFNAAALVYDQSWDPVPVNVNVDPSKLFSWSDP